ncbi:UNVERIFIED_CONTAM: Membralin-like protein [Sesamum radiatum]|uniref:Membralin-like protein n=1 Tax=Sesamum radiatum TaxID=300843 RepID=A0AAW2P219_SESRA
MQHLVLYFWNRFEVPALQRFMQNRRSHFQQHPDFHITSSTILASTLRITRLNTRNSGPVNTDLASGPVVRDGVDTGMPSNTATGFSGPEEQPSNDNQGRLGNPLDIGGQPVLRQPEGGGIPGAMSSFSSLLLWILGGASSESLNSFFSIFRDLRDQGQVYAEPPQRENHTAQNNE